MLQNIFDQKMTNVHTELMSLLDTCRHLYLVVHFTRRGLPELLFKNVQAHDRNSKRMSCSVTRSYATDLLNLSSC